MSTVSFRVTGGGRHELHCRRLERMLLGELIRFGFKVEPRNVFVIPEGPISTDGGAKSPLQLKIELSDDLLGQLTQSNSARRFVQAMGETVRRLGPENGWAQRRVQVTVPQADVSWNAG
jgi:hypothetical protein